MKIPTLLEQKEPEYAFRYSIGCYPSLWNPCLATTPLSEFDKESIIEKLKEPDESGRFQVLGIYQQSVTKTNEELAEKLRNESFVDAVISAGGKENPWLGFDRVRRDLILIAYDKIDQKNFQKRVAKKLPPKALKSRNDLLKTLEDAATSLIGSSMNEHRQLDERELEEFTELYIRHEDTLRRLAICHIDKLPDMLQKDTSFIRNFYREIQGKEYEDVGEYLEEAQKVIEKSNKTRASYGLTRDEVIFLEGGVQNIIAFLGESLGESLFPNN